MFHRAAAAYHGVSFHMKFARNRGLLLATLWAFVPWQAHAACLSPAACYRVDGRVAECIETYADGERFLKVSLLSPVATQSHCGYDAPRSPSPGEVEDRLANLARSTTFFIEASGNDSCQALVGAMVAGNVRELCCDTPPGKGACTLNAPLLGLRDGS
jgi:hypothetical protein